MLNKKAQAQFINQLLVIVHSHRHNKKEEFLQDKLDFTVVRDTMYKYSKKAQERFFASPFLTFLFIWFAHSPEGREFSYKKFGPKG